jgi:GTP-binding protein
MFIDTAVINIRSGKGGDGSIHFRREKFVPRGGPDGGDGGRGGDVVLEVDSKLNTLSNFRYKDKFIAENGRNGAKNKQTGRSGENLIIPVPAGTLVYNEETGELLGDLTEPEQKLTVAIGGRGGRGNARFVSSTRQTPQIGERGEPGKERMLRLELKLIADVGIVGAPNAGKSTLLAAVTNAKPKIGSYPFTTIEPNLGVLRIDYDTEFILADIPGLIEGAHQGIGLGHEFLRHVQRTKILIHMIDGNAENPMLDYSQINSELALFDPNLSEKPQIVAYNKYDLPEAKERWPAFLEKFKSKVEVPGGDLVGFYEPLPISALQRVGLDELINLTGRILGKLPEPVENEMKPLYRVDPDPREFEIIPEEDGFRILGEAIERAAHMTYWDQFESVRRFQHILENLGIDSALKEAGVQAGDTVYIGEYLLEWSD